jgi:hypothetical protein
LIKWKGYSMSNRGSRLPLYMDLVSDPSSDSFFRDFILFKIFLNASTFDSIENIFSSLLFGFSFSSGSIIYSPKSIIVEGSGYSMPDSQYSRRSTGSSLPSGCFSDIVPSDSQLYFKQLYTISSIQQNVLNASFPPWPI